MPKYLCRFKGRKSGAIGIFHWITAIVEAENEEQARIKLYDNYEHLTLVTIEKMED